MARFHAKERAIELRKAGHSYNYIAPLLGVAKGTLSVWLENVPYTPNFETIERIGRARVAAQAAVGRRIHESFTRARQEAKSDIGGMSSRDLFMLGLGLYIGEGTKSPTYTPCIVNANPSIIIIMIRWFREVVGVGMENFRICIHVYPDNEEEKCLQFWSETTNIPRSQFLKTQVDRRKNKKAIKSGKLLYGTAHLRVVSQGKKEFGVFLARKILAWVDVVLSV